MGRQSWCQTVLCSSGTKESSPARRQGSAGLALCAGEQPPRQAGNTKYDRANLPLAKKVKVSGEGLTRLKGQVFSSWFPNRDAADTGV